METPSFTYSRRIFHHESDGDKVCHFSNYLRLAEECLMEFLREKGFPMEQADHTLGVVDAKATYVAPLRFGEQFVINPRVTRVGRAQFSMDFPVMGADGSRKADIELRLAAISRDTGVSAALAVPIKTLLKQAITN